MRRALAVALLLAGPLCAQMPKGIYAWWSNRMNLEALNLSLDQRRHIQTTVRDYRGHLIEVRAAVNQAEEDLAAEFNKDPVDGQKANQAIERLIAARSDLTRTLSQMSLKLRTVLTNEQWQELQRRRPTRERDDPPTGASH
jgi:Spy/CpxP family protein refolding chaperone